MTRKELLEKLKMILSEGGIESPEAESMRIALEVLGVTRTEILLFGNAQADPKAAAKALEIAEKRLAGMPLQYLFGHAPFLDLDIAVGPGVLIPRPETEGLCELASEAIASRRDAQQPLRILDLCTGSGCIAAWAASAYPNAQVLACDVSEEALAIARVNLPERVSLLQGDLFDALPKHCAPFSLILSNPPYIPSKTVEELKPEVKDAEPRLALDGGAEGMDLVAQIIETAPDYLLPGGVLLMEIDDTQEDAVLRKCKESGAYASAQVLKDLAGRPRYLRCIKAD